MKGDNKSAPFIVKAIRNAEKVLQGVVMLTLIFLMLLGTADVIGRYLFSASITGTAEIGKIVLIVITAFGMAQMQAERGHISVEMFYEMFPRPVRKITDIFCTVAAAVFWALLAWQSLLVGLEYAATGRRIQILALPAAWLQYIAAFGALLLCIELLFQFIELVIGKDGAAKKEVEEK